MNELFAIPETPLTALQLARLRFDAAQKTLDAARLDYLEHGKPLSGEKEECEHALACLRSAEAAELRRLRE